MTNYGRLIVGILISAALALVVIFIVIPAMRPGYQFRDTTLNTSREILENLAAERTSLHVDNTNQAALLGIVGLVLVVDESSGQKPEVRHFDRTSVIPDFRPAVESVSIVPLDTTRYQGKISNKVSAGGAYTAFKSSLSDDQAAEVLIKDELYLGFRDRRAIPYDKLRRINREDGKKYFFVEGATLSSTTYRTFKEVTSGGTLDGTAFKADGKVFVSNDTFAYQPTLSVEVFEIALLQPATGGVREDRIRVLSLLRDQRSGQLDSEGAKTLVSLLKNLSKEDAKKISGASINVE